MRIQSNNEIWGCSGTDTAQPEPRTPLPGCHEPQDLNFIIPSSRKARKYVLKCILYHLIFSKTTAMRAISGMLASEDGSNSRNLSKVSVRITRHILSLFTASSNHYNTYTSYGTKNISHAYRHREMRLLDQITRCKLQPRRARCDWKISRNFWVLMLWASPLTSSAYQRWH